MLCGLHTTIYRLYTDTESYIFSSEKEACKFLGATQGSVANANCRKIRVHGYSVEKIGSSSHGQSTTRLYRIWSGMYNRCYNEKRKDYKKYGGSGIKICDEWLGKDGFSNFAEWATNNGYSEELSIDRIDNNGNYEPLNCRWATNKEQCINRHTNHMITINGETMTLSQLSEKYNVNYNTIFSRLSRGANPITGERIDKNDL